MEHVYMFSPEKGNSNWKGEVIHFTSLIVQSILKRQLLYEAFFISYPPFKMKVYVLEKVEKSVAQRENCHNILKRRL